MKVLRKLTFKNLRLNKTRTLVTIIGIMLSAALITVVTGVATSAQQTMLSESILHKGDYIFSLAGNFNANTADKLLLNRDVANVYELNSVGVAKFDSRSAYPPYVYICGANQNTFEDCFKCKLADGRYPQNSDELLLSQSFVKHSKKQYKIGDTVTFDLGSRWLKGKIDKNNIPTSQSKLAEYHLNDDVEYAKEEEELIPEFTKAYKIVGISENGNSVIDSGSSGACVKAYTVADFSDTAQRSAYYDYSELYVSLKPEAESRYKQVISEITGVDEKYLSNTVEEITLSSSTQTGDNPFNAERLGINTSVLKYKGLALSDSNMRSIYGLAIILTIIILISSVFIIRNSFAISITEKTKLYGMLSSIGTTPRQIKHNVYFEGFVLGAIGIPLGILLGAGVGVLLIYLINILLAEALNSMTIVYSIPWYAVVAAAVVCVLTIIFSCGATARRASKISPIEAIRSNNDIKISRKTKKKSYKTPWIVGKLFGAGGNIAWKNLKRSRKKYRTTVISIVVSVAIFISAYSFVDYGLAFYKVYNKGMKYNIQTHPNYGSQKDADYAKALEQYGQSSNLDGVKESMCMFGSYCYTFDFDASLLTDKIRKLNNKNIDIDIDKENNTAEMSSTALHAFDDVTYKEILKRLGYSYDEVKDKGLITNSARITKDDSSNEFENIKFLKKSEGTRLDFELNLSNDDSRYNSATKHIPLTLAGEIDNGDIQKEYGLSEVGSILVSLDWFRKNITPSLSECQIFLNAENPDELEQAITAMDSEISLVNYAKQARIMNAMLLIVQIFIYGFIIVISLIGITNIFNTITTNMRLRRKEFAMLRSVGMTNKEFNRMVRLESIFYAAKSLLLGIPFGLLGGFAVNMVVRDSKDIPYNFPWLAILISIVAVMLVVWMIMRFSISKVRKQNIIETIRNDNI